MKKLKILTILCVLLIVVNAYSESSKPPHTQKRENIRATETTNSHNNPSLIVSPVEPIKANEPANIPCNGRNCTNKIPEKSFWDKTTEDPVALFTFFLMLSTIGLWLAAIYQAHISRRTLKTSERAWIGVNFDRPYILGNDFIDLQIFNSGKSVGHIKDIQLFGFEVVDKGAPIPNNPKSVHPHGMGTWTAFPGEDTIQRWDVSIKQEEITEVVAKTKRLIIFGFVLYIDIFRKEHITKFYRVWMEDTDTISGKFIIPPDATPDQNEAT